MNILKKGLYFLYAVFFIIMTSVTMIAALNVNFADNMIYYLNSSIRGNYYPSVLIIILSLIFLLPAIVCIIFVFKTKKDKKAVSKYTNMGEVKISFTTLEDIVLNTARQFNEIRNITTSITKSKDDIGVTIKAVVLPEVCIPALSEQIQLSVKNAVEDNTGIIVEGVRVHIQSVYSEPSAKSIVPTK